jgi:hypothetical protein
VVVHEEWRELPDHARRVVEEPPTPFQELRPYHDQSGVYELDSRPVSGRNFDVVLLYEVGAVMLQTAVVGTVDSMDGAPVLILDTPMDKGRDRLYHTFPGAPQEVTEIILPPTREITSG